MMDNNMTADLCGTSTRKSFMDYRVKTFQVFTNLQTKAFDLMESYINTYYRECAIDALDEQFFERFYHYFLPLYSLKLSDTEVENISKEWVSFCEYVGTDLGITLINGPSLTAFNTYQNELQRIYYLIKEVRKYGEVPVLSWEPFLVDMKCYRNMKSKEKNSSKYVVFDQGYFILQDKIGNNVIFYKESPAKSYFKVKIDVGLTEEMRIGDIVHMSIKRKIFCTAWNIINVKAYFDKSAGVYLNLGGKEHETS